MEIEEVPSVFVCLASIAYKGSFLTELFIMNIQNNHEQCNKDRDIEYEDNDHNVKLKRHRLFWTVSLEYNV